MALASFSPYYKAPAEIIRMAEDLAGLPAWYAEVGDWVRVFDDSYRDDFLNQCVFSEGLPWGRCVVRSDWEEADAFVLSPWGWDPALAQCWRKDGRAGGVPDVERLTRTRELSGRQQCVKVLEVFRSWPTTCGEARICSSMEEVIASLHQFPEVILKAPWSGSGRGLTRTSLCTWTPNLEGWVGRILRTQGAIMAEPIYNKVVDFAMEFYLDAAHPLSFAGYSLFETDSHGNYKANLLASNQQIVDRLTQYVSFEQLEAVREQLLHTLSHLLGADYEGYFGVDMMICKEQTDDRTSYLIHPCVEINLRMNMGVVARLLFDRYMDVHSEGSYVVEHYSRDGEAVEQDNRLRAQYPQEKVDSKMKAGYFPLTPVTPTTRYQCYIMCHPLTVI